jgi:hypothetical protein
VFSLNELYLAFVVASFQKLTMLNFTHHATVWPMRNVMYRIISFIINIIIAVSGIQIMGGTIIHKIFVLGWSSNHIKSHRSHLLGQG